jgi:hypothetical protein
VTTLPLHRPDLSLPAPTRWAALGAPLRRAVVPALGLLCLLLPGMGSVGALLLGVAVAFAGLNVWEAETNALAKRLLMLSVMGLGAGLDLRAVVDVGLLGAGLAVGSIALCLGLGWGLARLFRVDALTGLLVTAGTAICGGSAIAAVAPTVSARPHQVTAALGTVFALNAVALLVFPLVGHALGMDAHQFGLWCAVAIHDTSSVVGAAMTYGPDALEVATTVKLARALWIIPLTAAWPSTPVVSGVRRGLLPARPRRTRARPRRRAPRARGSSWASWCWPGWSTRSRSSRPSATRPAPSRGACWC